MNDRSRVAIVLAIIAAAALVALALSLTPRCGATSPHGPRIADVFLIGGCP